MNAESQDRARLVAVLWNLKQAAKKNPLPGIPYIHFNTLLRQPEYRKEILQAARNSGDAELETLAREASALNVEEAALLNPSDKAWLEQRDQRIADAYGQELDVASREKRRYAWLAAALIALIAIIGVGYFGLQQMTGSTVLEGTIAGNQRLVADREYTLEGIVNVAPGARLTIDPGVVIRGRSGSALVVSRGGFLHAKGTASQPIVFTSDQPAGQRQPGDWGGLVMLGEAPVNTGSGYVEGFQPGDPRGAYGGARPEHACGVLEYARIEFAGFEALANNELNGLTLGGCGANTVIRYIQVHRGLDDGVEVFGGTTNLSRIVVTQARDDALDWDEGWVGDAQFLILQQTMTGDNAIEADNNSENPDATPRSRPRIYNATLVGSRQGAQRALTLRAGSSGEFGNILASSFAVEFTDIRDAASVAAIENGETVFNALTLHQIGPRGSNGFSPESGSGDDDEGFEEADYFSNRVENFQGRSELRLPTRSQSETNPEFTPAGSVTGETAEIPGGEFWDESARFPGAVQPGTNTPWYSGWTAFPAD